MFEPNPPQMIELSVPVGPKPGDVFRANVPIYPNGRPTFDLLENGIRMLAEQAIEQLRAETWLWEET